MKLVAGNAALNRSIIGDVIWKSRIMEKRPPGHDTVVDIRYGFRPIGSGSKKPNPPDGKAKRSGTYDATLSRAIARYITRNSNRIMSQRPADHELFVVARYEFRLAHTTVRISIDHDPSLPGDTTKSVIAREKRVNLVPSGEPFTEEHFIDLLELRLTALDRRFVTLMRERNNRPISPREWSADRFGRNEQHIRRINKACFLQGLWIRARKTHSVKDDWWNSGFQFVVMTEKTSATAERHRRELFR